MSVADRQSRPMAGLLARDLVLTEDGRPIEVKHLEAVEERVYQGLPL